MPNRINIAATIESVPLSSDAQSWLNLVADALLLTSDAATAHDVQDEWFDPTDDFQRVLVLFLNKDLSTLRAIYLTLRAEWLHQAAVLIRAWCESLITLRYIAQDKATRAKQFWDYRIVEEQLAYERYLTFDAHNGTSEQLARIRDVVDSRATVYAEAQADFTFTTAKDKQRPYANWCNKTLVELAEITDSVELYRFVYAHLSPYVHTSPWSLRFQASVSRRGHDPNAVLVQLAGFIRTTFMVWDPWAEFCDKELGWKLTAAIPELKWRYGQLARRVREKSQA